MKKIKEVHSNKACQQNERKEDTQTYNKYERNEWRQKKK